MRVSSICVNNYVSRTYQPKKTANHEVNFNGKHSCAKLLGGTFAGLGTLGALGGIAIMTGGVSLIPTLIYGACCGGAGAALGHVIDRGADKYDKESKNSKA